MRDFVTSKLSISRLPSLRSRARSSSWMVISPSFWKVKDAVAFDLDACSAKDGRLQTFLSRYPNAYNLVAKRPNDQRVRLQLGLLAAANTVRDVVGDFLRSLVLSMKACVGQKIACAWASICKHSSTIVEIHCDIVKKEIHDIECGH